MHLQVSLRGLIVNNGKVLVLREAETYPHSVQSGNVGKFCLVGGRIDPEEPWEEAFRREILEETGIKDITINRPHVLREIWRNLDEQERHILNLYFVCETPTDKVVLSDEHDEFMWVDSNTVANIPTTEPDGEVLREFLANPHQNPS